MPPLLRCVISAPLRFMKQLQPRFNASSNIIRSAASHIHSSVICRTDQDIILRILQQEKTSSELIKVTKRKPYMKNMLLANMDRDLIVYPQVIDKERYIFLDEMYDAVKAYFLNEVDGFLIDQQGEIPSSLLKDMKALGLFGLIIPQEYGGLGFSQTEFCKIAEAFAVNPSISLTLIAHQCLVAKAIMDYGTEEQKNKYLPVMATGEKIGAFCFCEESGGSDPSTLQTKLNVDDNANIYTLSGTKTWVTNGLIADIFIVVAKEVPDSVADEKLTAVIVESVNNKVVVEAQPTLGMKAAALATVKFNEVYLTSADVIGARRRGLQLALSAYNVARIGVGAICTGMSKHLIEVVNEYISSRQMYNLKMSDLANVREKVVRMTAETYAAESFTYFVAALDDLYEEQDYVVESSCLKMTATNSLLQNCESCLKLLASNACDDNSPYSRHVRDALALSNFLGSNDVTNLIVALDCLEFCGNNISTLILKKRRFLEHPSFNVKRIYREFLQVARANPTMTMEMSYALHPALDIEAKDLERVILYLSYGIEKSLVYFGSKVASEQHQFITSRIGGCTSICMMLLPAISRASRSMCLGVPNSYTEAKIFTYLMKLYVPVANHHIAEIFSGIDSLDINEVGDLSNEIVEARTYPIKSPFFRTIW